MNPTRLIILTKVTTKKILKISRMERELKEEWEEVQEGFRAMNKTSSLQVLGEEDNQLVCKNIQLEVIMELMA